MRKLLQRILLLRRDAADSIENGSGAVYQIQKVVDYTGAPVIVQEYKHLILSYSLRLMP